MGGSGTDDLRSNWAGNVRFAAGRIHAPSTVEEVQELVGSAAAGGRRVSATGSRHSFSAIADTDGDLISIAGLDRVLAIDRDAGSVTVEGGIRYGELSAHLHESGLALHNLPSLPHITVAGAISTATHGSGDRNGNLATAVRAITLVTADGTLLDLEQGDERLAGAVVGLGATGIVVSVTLAVEPTFEIAQTVYRELPFADGLDRLDEVMSAAYSVSLFTDYQREVFQQVWWKGRVGVDGEPPVSMFGALPAVEAMHPVETISADSCTQQFGVHGAWPDRLPHFRLEFTPSSGDELQSEYFVARSDAADALRAVMGLAAELRPLLKISEIRTVAADDLWLSGSFGRDTLALHFTWIPDQPRVMAFLPVLEHALADFSPRPHWGKLTAIAPETIRRRYPKWSEYERLLLTLDPAGTFRNAYVDALIR
jgi:xylitol oxidase